MASRRYREDGLPRADIFLVVFSGRAILLRASEPHVKEGFKKWEIPKRTIEVDEVAHGIDEDFIVSCARLCLEDEFCLSFKESTKVRTLPVWINEVGKHDLFFLAIIECSELTFSIKSGANCESFGEGVSRGVMRYFLRDDVQHLEIVSERMKRVIDEAFRGNDHQKGL